jgi:hypothetical protein
MKSLELILENVWEEVMNTFNHPPLEYPRIDESTDTAAITIKDHKISINKNFVNELVSKGLDEVSSVKSLIMHEVNHYMYCPYELKKYIAMLQQINKNSKMSQDVCNYYMDVIVNLDLATSIREDTKDAHILQLYKVLDKKSDILKLTVGIYEKYSGQHLDSGINDGSLDAKKLQPYLQKLLQIDYFDENNWVENAGKFAKIVKDLVDEKDTQNPLGNLNGKSYSISEQSKVLKELAESVDPKEFRKYIREEKLHINSRRASVEYYNILSNKFPVTIIPKGGTNYGFDEHRKWSVEDPMSSIDIFNSYGKIFPGITQSWKAVSHMAKGTELPDLFLAIDSSGSMTNPITQKSLAVLSAFCLTKNYLANNKQVASYNFSDTTEYTDFNNIAGLFENLAYYANGGTESFDPKYVNNKIGDRYCDIVICSDMDMANIDNVMIYLSGIKNVNRVTLLCMDDTDVFTTAGKIGVKKNNCMAEGMGVHIIRNDNDIKNIVVGTMSNYT